MLRARANGETFVSATMCPQQCVLVCQGLKRMSKFVEFYDSSKLSNLPFTDCKNSFLKALKLRFYTEKKKE